MTLFEENNKKNKIQQPKNSLGDDNLIDLIENLSFPLFQFFKTIYIEFSSNQIRFFWCF